MADRTNSVISSLFSSSQTLIDRGSARMLQAAQDSGDIDLAFDAVVNAKMARFEIQLGAKLSRLADDTMRSTLDILT